MLPSNVEGVPILGGGVNPAGSPAGAAADAIIGSYDGNSSIASPEQQEQEGRNGKALFSLAIYYPRYTLVF